MGEKGQNQQVLSWQEQAKQKGAMRHHAPLPPAKPGEQPDVASPDTTPLSGLRLVILSVVLLAVTLNMLMSLLFLWSGGRARLPLPALPPPAPWSLVGLGGGVGLVLWIALACLMAYRRKGRLVQQPGPRSAPVPVASEGSSTISPDRGDRPGGEWFPTPIDRWMAPGWEGEPWRKTEPLEVLHMRRRLQTLRVSYQQDFPEEEGAKSQELFRRTTDALGEESQQRERPRDGWNGIRDRPARRW